uniref:Potassium channel tetramerisation-type BTB domain-containing protein n=1 Tax=Plectus sambesii TaxID=2011161 RepID=A0A914W1L0_9BILA
MSLGSGDIIRLNVGGQSFGTQLDTLLFDRHSLLYQWFDAKPNNPPLPVDRNGAYFIDRDPHCFGIVLNYLRLRTAGQVWEACLPKDPDRLALLTQEADYFRLPALRDQAVALLQSCTERADVGYVNEVLIKSISCPMGFKKLDDSVLSDHYDDAD